MRDELDEGLTDERAIAALWRDQIEDGQQGEEKADEDTRDELYCPVAPPPAWELVIPPRCQQLLTVGLGYKLTTKERIRMACYLHLNFQKSFRKLHT